MEEKPNYHHYGNTIGLRSAIRRGAAVISPLEVRRACARFTSRIGQVRGANGGHIVSPYARCIDEYTVKIAKFYVFIYSSYAAQKQT